LKKFLAQLSQCNKITRLKYSIKLSGTASSVNRHGILQC
jgi:hypothetical protein